MRNVPRLLVDVRENANMRGFHALAALHLIADQLHSAELYRLGGDRWDERVACDSFSFDTALQLRAWNPEIGADGSLEVYLFAADDAPSDEASLAAQSIAQATVAALTFPSRPSEPPIKGVVVAGHDTAKIAAAVLSALEETGAPSPQGHESQYG